MHPEETSEECGARQDGRGVRCSRQIAHDGQHGYAGMFWDRADEEEPVTDDAVDTFAGLHQLISDAVSVGIQQAASELIERLAKSYATP